MSGKFVIFEGGEGAGKSTLVQNLKTALEADNHAVTVTREPGGSNAAEEIRQLLLARPPEEAYDPDVQLLLVYAARFDHVKRVILPKLEAGETVLCDRFEISSYAYQVHTQQADFALFEFLHKKLVALMQPERFACTYLHCDIDPEVGLARAKSRGGAVDVFDDAALEFHHGVRVGMKEGQTHISDHYRHVTIDAHQSPEDMVAQALPHIYNN